MKSTSFFLLFLYAQAIAQNKVQGSWQPQKTSNTCWAAALTNVSKVSWNRQPAISPTVRYDDPKTATQLRSIADSFFNFRMLKYDSVLTYEAINQCFGYPYSRPLIYGYHLYGISETGGHYVNITGTRSIDKLPSNHQRWLEIYNPKPDRQGSRLLKNYTAYTYTWKHTYNSTQSTFYQFVDKSICLPSEIPNGKIPIKNWDAIDQRDVICDKSIQELTDELVRSGKFNDFLGTSPVFYNQIPLVSYIITTENSSVENQNSVSFDVREAGFMIPVYNDGTIKAGIFWVNSPHSSSSSSGLTLSNGTPVNTPCYLMNTIEEIRRMGLVLSKLFDSAKNNPLTIFYANSEYRFLKVQYQEKGNDTTYNYYDLDGYFGKLYTSYSQVEFFKKLLGKDISGIKEIYDPEFGKTIIQVKF